MQESAGLVVTRAAALKAGSAVAAARSFFKSWL